MTVRIIDHRLRTIHWRELILVLWLVFPQAGFAQQEYSRFYVIENLETRELIKSLAKDKDGYLWIATDDGVLQYDGHSTMLHYKDLPSPYTKAFLEQHDGRFYVLHDFGIKEIVRQYDSIYFRPLAIGTQVFDMRLSYPKSVYEDGEHTLWIGELNAVLRFNEQGFKRFDLGEAFRSINYHRTFSFAEDAFGHLWIAPWKGPLLFYDKQKDTLERIDTDYMLTAVSGMVNVKGDYLLIGGKEGLLKLKIDSDHRILEQTLDRRVTDISTLEVVGQTGVYAGTWNDGLFYYDFEDAAGGFKRPGNVPVHDILALYYDEPKHELWVAGSEEIGLFKPTIISAMHQAGQNRVETLAVDEKNNIYYSTGDKLFYLDRAANSPPELLLSADDTYFDRILLEGTRLWIGDAFGKIFYYDVKTGARRHLLNDLNISIKYVYGDRAGNKWFAGHNQGLIKVDAHDELTFYRSLTQTQLVREGGNGHLYCGSNGKDRLLTRYDAARDTFDLLPLKYGFACPDNVVLNDFQFDSQGHIWMATDQGLFKIENDGGYSDVQRVSIAGLNEHDAVRAVAVIDDFVCFANTQGLVIYKAGEYIVFGQDSGLPSAIVKERGLVPDAEGNLLIATAKGMAMIKKTAIILTPTPAPVFKSVMINGDKADPDQITANTFPYKTRLEAEFISLSYPASNIIYQSRIRGIDDGWSAASANRTLNVLGFTEGDYTLEVRAREDGKLWSAPLALPFTIRRPWYRTWWAILTFAGAGVLTVVVATRIHNTNLIRQKRKLQEIIEERTAEINRQKNEMIAQQAEIIRQKEELITKNEAVYKSQQALNEADMNYLHLKEKQLQDQIEYKNKQITTHALNILQKNETLKGLKSQLEDIVKNASRISVTEIRKTLRTIDDSFKLDKDWEDFRFYFEQIHTGFYSKLKISYPDLTPLELRHCALIRLNLTLAECASILGISPDSLKVSRTRLRKKLNLDPSQSLTDFVLGI